MEEPFENTCTWLFERLELLGWIDSHSNFIWIKGKPGAGKSTLMKYAIQTIEHKTMMHSAVIPFFFNGRGAALEKTPLGLYQSLLKQALQNFPVLIAKFLPEYHCKHSQDNAAPQWLVAEVRENFRVAVLEVLSMPPLYIFVDALDECEEDEARKVVTLFDGLRKTAARSKHPLNICFSSRHYPNITAQSCSEISVEDENEQDITAYVGNRLFIEAEKFAEMMSLEREIAEKASGVFLWVCLLVELLRKADDNGESVDDMRKLLSGVPQRLDELFIKIFGTVASDKMAEYLLIMQWVLLAKRTLALVEMQYALGFSSENCHS